MKGPPPGSRFRRFGRDERGASAVEFALVAGPFMFLMFAILEVAMIFWSAQVLETALANASRQIYTGQFQGASANQTKTPQELQSEFKTLVCANVTALFNCTSKVSIDVKNFSSSYSGVTPPAATKTQNGTTSYDSSAFGYQAVGAKQIALVTAAMEYPTIVPLLAKYGTLSNGNRVIMATATFRTEPFTP